MTFVNKLWGCEKWFENNNLYCGKQIIINKGKWSSNNNYHFHNIKDETFFIIEGELKLVIVENVNEVEYILKPGESKRIYPNTLHKFSTDSNFCKFIEVSTTHDDNDSYRITNVEFKKYKNELNKLIGIFDGMVINEEKYGKQKIPHKDNEDITTNRKFKKKTKCKKENVDSVVPRPFPKPCFII